MNRSNENGTPPKRRARVYLDSSDGYWYYTTRESIIVGPFDTKGAAEEGVCAYIDFVLHAEPGVMTALKRYGHNAA